MAFELIRFIRKMRTVTPMRAGGLVSRECNSLWMNDYYGMLVHATPQDVQSFITFWFQYSPQSPRVYPKSDTCSRQKSLIPPPPTHFVFTHQGLAPRNILLDKHLKLWLVDWQSARFYPQYFEYVGMQSFHCRAWTSINRLRWWIFSWISVGIYSRELRGLERVREFSLSNIFGDLWCLE